jgi:hypothetical protein
MNDILLHNNIQYECDNNFNIHAISNIIRKMSFIHIDTLIIYGGGISGISYLGAIDVLLCYNALNNVNKYCGVSVGSLISLLYIIGYTPFDMLYILQKINLPDVKNIKITNLFCTYGFDDGNRLMNIIYYLIENKHISRNITFKELYEMYGKMLIIVVTNINSMELEYMSYIDNPNMSICQAIRMSISVPFMFSPCIYNDNMYVDGMLLNMCKFPCYHFERENAIELKLTNSQYNISINSMNDYICRIISCICSNTKNSDCAIQININTDMQFFLNFSICSNDILQYYKLGYDYAIICLNKYIWSDRKN